MIFLIFFILIFDIQIKSKNKFSRKSSFQKKLETFRAKTYRMTFIEEVGIILKNINYYTSRYITYIIVN